MKAFHQNIKSLDDALAMMKNKGIQHQWYCHYTSLDKLKMMLDTKMMYLTRCSSLRFNDTIEAKKYGTGDEARKRYIGCFSIGKPEIVAMWGLYCPPTYKAIRLMFSKRIMKEWAKKIEVFKIGDGKGEDGYIAFNSAKAYFSDIVYASVRGDDGNPNRTNILSWEGQYSWRVNDLEKQKTCVEATGCVKDYEWRYEREMRLIVSVQGDGDAGERIAVRLPDSVLAKMKFTLSPWADADEKKFVQSKVTALLASVRESKSVDAISGPPAFEESVLSNGLTKWAASRGLS